MRRAAIALCTALSSDNNAGILLGGIFATLAGSSTSAARSTGSVTCSTAIAAPASRPVHGPPAPRRDGVVVDRRSSAAEASARILRRLLDHHRLVVVTSRALCATRVPFQPRVDPFTLQANRAASADACMLELPTLARCVDRVAADAGILCALGNGQPGLHGPSVRAPQSQGASKVVCLGFRASASTVLAGALFQSRG